MKKNRKNSSVFISFENVQFPNFRAGSQIHFFSADRRGKINLLCDFFVCIAYTSNSNHHMKFSIQIAFLKMCSGDLIFNMFEMVVCVYVCWTFWFSTYSNPNAF